MLKHNEFHFNLVKAGNFPAFSFISANLLSKLPTPPACYICIPNLIQGEEFVTR